MNSKPEGRRLIGEMVITVKALLSPLGAYLISDLPEGA